MKIDRDTNVCISVAAVPGNFGSSFHNAAYRSLGLNWIYLPRAVESALDLETVISGVRALGIKGCSVSMPHKEAVIQYIDELDSSARMIGAVNTIKKQENGSLTGYNTDYCGAKKALEQTAIDKKDVVMIGAGGVAKAIGHAVNEMGGRLIIANRTQHRSDKIVAELNADLLPWKEVPNVSGHLLINATSVGMLDEASMIVRRETIARFDAVFDAVIQPRETLLLRTATELGRQIISGTLMCVYQAAEQFKIYTGIDAPKEIVSKTLKTLDQ